MDKPPQRIKIKEIFGAISHNKDKTEILRKKEKSWPKYDSSIQEYYRTFETTLPQEYQGGVRRYDEEGLKRYIEDNLKREGNGGLVAVEFGGPGSALFEGFSTNFFTRTAGVCLQDIRAESQIETDTRNNHQVIVGDVLNPLSENDILKKVKIALGKEKIDLIVSSIGGPLLSLNLHPAIMDRIVRDWYEMLADNGMMFIEFTMDSYRQKEMDKIGQVRHWAEKTRKVFPELGIQIGKGWTNYKDQGTIRIHKKKGSPEKLLSAAQLFK